MASSGENNNPISTSKKRLFTSHQWKLLIVIIFVNICSAMCYSIQAPFYPNEAKKKGVSSTIYGMVFGVFELVDFILCPIYGKYIRQIGPKFMLNAGNFVMAICCILFGLLDKTARTPFIALSFIVRIIEAMGQAGYITAVFAIVATEFSDNLATAFTITETAFAVGIIVGPSVGGVLYEVGGFFLPFAVNGVALIIAAIVTAFLLPEIENTQPRSLSVMKLLRIPSIAICYYSVFAVAFSFGYITVLFEPFLKSEFHVSTAVVGLIFVIPGGSYALTTFIWGTVADKQLHSMLIIALGGVFISLGFFLVGPAPFLQVKPAMWLVIVSLILHGLGASAEFISAFLNSNTEAIRHGFPEGIETYGLISGLWSSGIALGSFIGTVLAGVLGDTIGFANGALLVCGQQVLVVVLALISYRHQTRAKTEESTCLLQESHKITAIFVQ